MPDAEMEIRHIASFESVRTTLLEQRAFWEGRLEFNPESAMIIARLDDSLQVNTELLQLAHENLERRDR